MNVSRQARIAMACLGAALVGYLCWWGFAAWQMRTIVLSQFDDWRANGLHVGGDNPDFGGFPFAIRLDFANLEITHPQHQWQWIARDLELEARPWNLRSLNLHLGGTQRTTVPVNGRLLILEWRADRADFLASIGDGGRLERIDVAMDHLTATTPRKPFFFRMAALALALDFNPVPEPGSDPAFAELMLSVRALDLPDILSKPMGSRIERFSTRMLIREIVPSLELQAGLTGWRNAGGALEIPQLSIAWAGLEGDMAGRLTLDDYFRPEGAFEASVAGLPQALLNLGDAGLIPKKTAGLAAAGAQFFAVDRNAAGQPSVTLPVSLRNGGLFLGPLKMAGIPSLLGLEPESEPAREPDLPDGLPSADHLAEPPVFRIPEARRESK
ncbi:DUF2125 domain-containing protein [Aestuariispira insulae]|uniref:DUF2125 domain-containing protein n=1 Tax=Aestuariispira insulae TaxID=1461337 RepID=A0A3D9HQ91_9PROT|nr:DUF2125 domain-containing protein [Aestuariispira insulae]RED51565.1 hypothetical protein DFP90_103368 [Aestuariispira insulae]